MPAASPDTLVAARIASVLGPSWVVGVNVFRGPMRPAGSGVPVAAIFVLLTGGPAREPYLGGASAADHKRVAVQVMVRTASGDYAGGRDLAARVANAVHKSTLAGYVQILAQSEPLHLQQNASDEHLFSLNFLADLVE